MNDRFPEALKGALQGTLLIPSNLRKLSTSVEEAIKKEFAEDLPMPQLFEHEVSFVLVGKPLQTALPTTISANIRYRSSAGNLLNRTMIASPLWPSRWLLVTSVSTPRSPLFLSCC